GHCTRNDWAIAGVVHSPSSPSAIQQRVLDITPPTTSAQVRAPFRTRRNRRAAPGFASSCKEYNFTLLDRRDAPARGVGPATCRACAALDPLCSLSAYGVARTWCILLST